MSPMLASLELEDCPQLSDDALVDAFPPIPEGTLFSRWRGLKEVSFKGSRRITDRGVKAIGQGTTGLRILKLGQCTRVASDGLRITLELHHKTFRVLDLSDTAVTDEGGIMTLTHTPRLSV